MHTASYSHVKSYQLQAPIKVIILKRKSWRHCEFRHTDSQTGPVEWGTNR